MSACASEKGVERPLCVPTETLAKVRRTNECGISAIERRRKLEGMQGRVLMGRERSTWLV